MWIKTFIVVFGYLLQSQLVLSAIPCTEDSECSDAKGAMCVFGNCACPAGQQFIFGNSLCADASPYIKMPCFEDHQCSRLLINFQCRRFGDDGNDDDNDYETTTEMTTLAPTPDLMMKKSRRTRELPSNIIGECACRDGFHFLNGRCWRTVAMGGACNRNEDCVGPIFFPFSMTCDSTTKTCHCSDGYYFRQRGECRKIAYDVDDGCVINEDCQSIRGTCNIQTFRCETEARTEVLVSSLEHRNYRKEYIPSVVRQDGRTQHGAKCNDSSDCDNPFICDSRVCICPTGYYGIDGSDQCYSELGSPSTPEQCVGILAVLKDGICTCPANFFYRKDLRDCVKVSRTLTDFCLSDEMCHTFGSDTRCTPPIEPWNLRHCECIPGLSLWDPARSMCRSFVGIGEICQIDSDCLAGDQDIDCVLNENGQGICSCPNDTIQDGQLCIAAGLELGDACQISIECTGTPNTVCENRRCSCAEGYLELEDTCVAGIGGACTIDEDCNVENSVCVTEDDTSNCQCADNFIRVDQECIPMLENIGNPCNMSIQCAQLIGENSVCEETYCSCLSGHHLRDGWCWPQTGLFQECRTASECYLDGMSERVVCRNSLCQCSFRFPYSEELHTCSSAPPSIKMGSIFIVLLAVYYAFSI